MIPLPSFASYLHAQHLDFQPKADAEETLVRILDFPLSLPYHSCVCLHSEMLLTYALFVGHSRSPLHATQRVAAIFGCIAQLMHESRCRFAMCFPLKESVSAGSSFFIGRRGPSKATARRKAGNLGFLCLAPGHIVCSGRFSTGYPWPF